MGEADDINAKIIYHFNVKRHRISLQQSIDTAQATKAILKDFNDQFFDGKLEYHLHLLPPEEGGWINKIAITLAIGASLVKCAEFLDTDIGKGITKDLTGEEPVYWSHKAITDLQNLWIEESSIDDSSDAKSSSHKTDELTQKLLVNCMAGMPVYFLKHETEILLGNNITPDKFRESFKARNKFYKACIKNKEIQGLSFDPSHVFPIERKDFKKKIITIPTKTDEPYENTETQKFQYETAEIFVNSPNWKRKGRKWQAPNSKGKFTEFIIQDITFWQHVKVKDIPTIIEDNMKVQWMYQSENGQQKNVHVLKVLSYNEEDISEPLSEKEIQEICDRENITLEFKKDAKDLDNQLNLFSDSFDKNKNDSDDD